MTAKVCFLFASDGTPLTKTYTHKQYPGTTVPTLSATSYPLVKEFDSHEHEVATLEDFHAVLVDAAQRCGAYLVGRLGRPITGESRAGLTPADQPVYILVLDFDGLTGVELDTLLTALGLGDVDYIVQYSPSSKLPGKLGLRAHVFIKLKTPAPPEALTRWLQQRNFDNPFLKNALTLTASKLSLHYPLDTCTGQPSRLIYIAPPELHGLKDPHADDRITFVRKTHRELDLDFSLISSKVVLDTRRAEIVQQLRQAEGLSASVGVSGYRKGYDGQRYEVLKGAGRMTLSDIQEARGFVYMNLNGGDSLAYYHPIDKPDLLYNFKDEPVLLLEDINPDYHARAVARAKQHKRQQAREERRKLLEEAKEEAQVMFDPLDCDNPRELPEPVHFYCIDDATGKYKVGTFDPVSNTLDLRDRQGPSQLDHFAAQFNLPQPTGILSCKIDFDPTNLSLYTPPKAGRLGHINLYCPSQYRVDAQKTDIPLSCPPTIYALLLHVMGDSHEFVEHFLNWLSYIFQTGKKAQTAWLFSGTTGTGKDTLVEHVLVPMLGRQQCMYKRLDQLEEQFDSELRHKQLCIINEASMDKVRNAQKVFDKLNDWITGTHLGMRGMYQQHAMYESYLNLLALTNHFNAIRVDPNDRRWNVPPRQEKNLRLVMDVGTPLHQRLHSEHQTLADVLWNWKVDVDKVKVPMDSTTKAALQHATAELPRVIADSVQAGRFSFLMDMLPAPGDALKSTMLNNPILDNYLTLMDKIVLDVRAQRESLLTRDDIALIYQFIMGDRWDYSKAAGKFSKVANHFGWNLNSRDGTRVTLPNGRSVPGKAITFEASDKDLADFIRYYSRNKGLQVAK